MGLITENIENHILSELNKAEISIDIAVAWITSNRIIQKIEDKRKQNVFIRILCWKDEDDKNNNGKLKDKFRAFLKKNEFEIYEIHKQHNKFCIIDKKTIIRGSYNWTEGAKTNKENIEISDDVESIKSFQKEFDKLRSEKLKEIDDKNLKKEVKYEASAIFNQEILGYIEILSEKNKTILKDIDSRINSQKETLYAFEKRTKLFKNIVILSVGVLIVSLIILYVSTNLTIKFYKESVLTKQEVREELLKEFDSQNKKLYDVDEYKIMEENKRLVEEWISKNPRDSKKLVEYIKTNKK